jgi:sugar phosphate isomerase/epimerase
MMSHVYSLAYLTAAPLPPPEAIRLAAKLGYQAVGLRIMPAAPGGAFDALMDDAALLRDTKAALRDTGVTVFDMEIVRLAASYRTEQFKRFLEVSGELSAKAVLVAGDDPDEARLTASYSAFCAAAAPYGLTADLEFMPWTAVKDCNTAVRIAAGAAQPNAGILVDALHVGRSTTTLDDLAAVPRDWLHYAQLCDAEPGLHFTEAELIFTARAERLLPGQGGIDLRGILGRLPADIPLSVEIANDRMKAELGVKQFARQALDRAKAVAAG